MGKKRLREGFTTGSAAAAAAKAAVLFLGGQQDIKNVPIPLPAGGRYAIDIDGVEVSNDGVRATVIKDGGDDPDVTHGAKIGARVFVDHEGKPGAVRIDGGEGVGRVTRPGLPVHVGEPAINPVPRHQIGEAVREGLAEIGMVGSVSGVIDVVDGERIARKTFNPRLGIIGGISILGTRGTVKPFSHQAYKDTITVSMDVAKAGKLDHIVLSTGGKSEGFIRSKLKDMPDSAFIQVGDFFAFSLSEAAKRTFHHVIYSCFFGKLVKMAQGIPNTHARRSEIDFHLLANWCVSGGLDKEKISLIIHANTAREVLSIIHKDGNSRMIIKDMMIRAISSARSFLGPYPNVTYYLFDFDGVVLGIQRREGDQKAG